MVFAGALLGWFLQQYRVLRTEDTNIINDHVKDIDKFSEAASAYWLKKPKNDLDDKVSATKVHAAWGLISRAYPSIQKASGMDQGVYKDLVFDLYNAATSGKFEQSKRSENPEQALEVAESANALIIHLRQRRQHIISTRRVLESLREVVSGLYDRCATHSRRVWDRAKWQYRQR